MSSFLGLIALFLLWTSVGHAQGMDELESILSGPSSSPDVSIPSPTSNGFKSGVSDLSSLEAFEDIAVIQKRFLPKTSRYEASAAAGLVMNDPFFNTYSLMGRLGYYFTEAYGLELNFHKMFNSVASVTEDIEDRAVETSSLVKPTSFYGLDFKWNPIYGKMSLLNKKIIPFDLYFSAGGGISQIDINKKGSTSAPTLHFATGQNFALSKSTSFRWDFSLNSFAATTEEGTKTANVLTLNMGMSFFFPEASYR